MITVYTGERESGKTTVLLSWLVGGERVDGYPGWNRVMVVAGGPKAVEEVKPAFMEMIHAKADSLNEPVPEWDDLDFDHRVFDYGEWLQTQYAAPGTEVAVDGLDKLNWAIKNLPGEVVKATIQEEIDVRHPEQFVTLKEAVEHGAAADGRFFAIREAVLELGLKPTEKGITEGHVLTRENLEALAQLYFTAGAYDWMVDPEKRVLPYAEVPEESSGVAPGGRLLTKDAFLDLLEDIRKAVVADDTWEGSLAYETHVELREDEAGNKLAPETHYRVQAAYRVGNSMGQGGMVLVRAGIEVPT